MHTVSVEVLEVVKQALENERFRVKGLIAANETMMERDAALGSPASRERQRNALIEIRRLREERLVEIDEALGEIEALLL
jgi:hypothetical protein